VFKYKVSQAGLRYLLAGKFAIVTASGIHRVVDGWIVDSCLNWDALGLVRQLGGRVNKIVSVRGIKQVLTKLKPNCLDGLSCDDPAYFINGRISRNRKVVRNVR